MDKKIEITKIESYPGYDVVVPKKQDFDGVSGFKVFHGAKLACAWPSIRNPSTMIYSLYQVGSVIGYAMEHDDDIEKALKLAEERDHEKHYIFNLGSTISNMRTEKKIYVKVEEGDNIRFEGKMFRVEKTWNKNLKLVAL